MFFFGFGVSGSGFLGLKNFLLRRFRVFEVRASVLILYTGSYWVGRLEPRIRERRGLLVQICWCTNPMRQCVNPLCLNPPSSV